MHTSPQGDQLHALRGATMPVKDLVGRFGFAVRNHETVPLITKALKEAGLTTRPDFARCRPGVTVTIVGLEHAQQEQNVESPEAEVEVEPLLGPQYQLLIGDLPSARCALKSVSSDASVAEAVNLMRTYDYSQMPVIDGKSDLRGVVTWQSVARRLSKSHQGETLTLAEVMNTSVESAETHHKLFPRLPRLHENGFFLVRERNGEFSGIVTTSDVSDWFYRGSRPFFLVGEIEEKLRSALAPIAPESIQLLQAKDRKTGKLADLTFGQYAMLVSPAEVLDRQKEKFVPHADQNWKELGWSTVDRAEFVRLLERVRIIRNSIAHYDSTPPSEGDLDTLQQLGRILDDHQP